ncbi:hypothetical protein ACFLQX_00335 [Bacteroidota bacterium]
MTKKIFKPVSYLLILALGLTMTFTSCEQEPEVMDLPPKESLQIDLSAFPSDETGKKAAEAIFGNWFYSAANIVVWNVGIAANIIIPVAAYAEAFNHVPVYQGDNIWEWSYSVTIGADTYVASLLGARINNEEFSMKMYLTKSGMDGFEDFEWFTGVIRYDHTAASWSVSHSPADPTAYLDIVYHKDFEAETADIRYTCVDSDHELYNAFIEYGIDPEYYYDAYYTISKTTGTTYIEWKTTSAEGRVMDEVHFSDEAWHCWDSQLLDVVCPE